MCLHCCPCCRSSNRILQAVVQPMMTTLSQFVRALALMRRFPPTEAAQALPDLACTLQAAVAASCNSKPPETHLLSKNNCTHSLSAAGCTV